MKPFVKTIKTGGHLFHENDHSRELYIIQKGRVRVYRRIGSREVELTQLAKGAVLGEMALIDGKPRSASAQAIEECSVVIIDADTFFTKTKGVPPWFVSIIRVVSQKIRKANRRLQKNQNGVNVILALGLLCRGYGGDQPNAWLLDCEKTRNMLVRLLNATTQEIDTVLDFLQRRKMLTIDNNRIIIGNAERFEEYGRFLRMFIHKEFLQIKPLPFHMIKAFRNASEELTEIVDGNAKKFPLDGARMAAIIQGAGAPVEETIAAMEERGMAVVKKNGKESSGEEEDGLRAAKVIIDRGLWRTYTLYHKYQNAILPS